jgi:hypothetical protein
MPHRFSTSTGKVLVTLFIGVVTTAMEEAKAEHAGEEKRDERLRRRCQALGIEVGDLGQGH